MEVIPYARPFTIETDSEELFAILWVLQHGHPDNAYNQISGVVANWTKKLIAAGIVEGNPDRPGLATPVVKEP